MMSCIVIAMSLVLGATALPKSDCSVLGCAWAGGLCLDVGDACDTTACRDAYKAAFMLRHCNKTETTVTAMEMRNAVGDDPVMDCRTDGKAADYFSMTLKNPSSIKTKVRTCDVKSVNGSTATCQGNPLKPGYYLPCGSPDARVMPGTTRTIHFNKNVTFMEFSNGVGVKSYYRPKDDKGNLMPWPASHTINIALGEAVAAADPCATGTPVKIGSKQYKSKVLIVTAGEVGAPAVEKPDTKVSATVIGTLESDGNTFWKSQGDFDYTYGETPRHLIEGFDAGSYGMREGETRMVCIPPEEGYGQIGRPGIPKNSTLVFTLGCDKVSAAASPSSPFGRKDMCRTCETGAPGKCIPTEGGKCHWSNRYGCCVPNKK